MFNVIRFSSLLVSILYANLLLLSNLIMIINITLLKLSDLIVTSSIFLSSSAFKSHHFALVSCSNSCMALSLVLMFAVLFCFCMLLHIALDWFIFLHAPHILLHATYCLDQCSAPQDFYLQPCCLGGSPVCLLCNLCFSIYTWFCLLCEIPYCLIGLLKLLSLIFRLLPCTQNVI